MRFIADIEWSEEAVHKVADHGLTTADVEEAIDTAVHETTSRSSHRPLRFGYSIGGDYIAVVFVWTGPKSILVVTAYPVPEPA